MSFSGFVRFPSDGSSACLDHLVFTAAVWLGEEFFLSLFSFLSSWHQAMLADAALQAAATERQHVAIIEKRLIN